MVEETLCRKNQASLFVKIELELIFENTQNRTYNAEEHIEVKIEKSLLIILYKLDHMFPLLHEQAAKTGHYVERKYCECHHFLLKIFLVTLSRIFEKVMSLVKFKK